MCQVYESTGALHRGQVTRTRAHGGVFLQWDQLGAGALTVYSAKRTRPLSVILLAWLLHVHVPACACAQTQQDGRMVGTR